MKKKPKRRPTAAQPGGADSPPRSASNRPEGEPSSLLNRYRVPGLVVLYVLLALNFAHLPKVAVNMTHDPGSHMTFEIYARDHYQFGVDVIQNVGPYGYLNYPYDYSGILPTQKLLFGILFGLVAAWYALEARKYFFSTTAKVVWFLAVFLTLVPNCEELDPATNLFVLLAGHHLLLYDRDRPGRFFSDAVLCVCLGLLSLMKSTNLMLVGLLMMLVIAERIRSRRFLDLACNVGCVGFTIFFLWILAGQKISNAPAFVRGAMAFSAGYNEALSHTGKPEMVWLGITVPILFVIVNVLRLLKFRAYAYRLPTIVFEAACVFLVWKHGHVRAGHEGFYWAFMIPAAPLFFLAHEKPAPGENSPKHAKSGGQPSKLMAANIGMYHLAMVPVAIIFFCAISAAVIEQGNANFAGYANPWTAITTPFVRMSANLWELVDWPGHSRALKANLAANRVDAAMPKVKAAIGDATIDEFGFLPGMILLNDFHYDPRPIPINFAATTGMLMARNAEFYRNDATAPAFLMANIGQIDGRFAPQDDALALLEVLDRYQPLLAERGFMLLKHLTNRPATEMVQLDTRTITWGDSLPVPATNGDMLWCRADIHFSLRGKIRSFLFQPPQLFIVMESADHRIGPIRLLQSGARTGFLLRPLILNGVDFLAAYGIHVRSDEVPTPDFDHVRFVTADQDCFQPDINVTFSSIRPKK